MFSKYKRLLTLYRAITALLLGSAAALGLIGTSVLVCTYISPHPMREYTYPAAIITGIVLALLLFLLTGRSDMDAARDLNKRYSLGERLETMLEYKNESSPMIEMQREDTERALSEVKHAAPSLKGVIISASVFVICLSVFLFSAFAKAEDGDSGTTPDIPPEGWSVTEMQLSALRALIDEIKLSEMKEPYKADLTEVLTLLSSDIVNVKTTPEMTKRVTEDINKILFLTDSSSLALELIEAASAPGTDTSERLAEALNYYKWPKEDEQDRFASALDKLKNKTVHPDAVSENPDFDKICKETRDVLLAIAGESSSALLRSGMTSDDPLYKALVRLCSANEKREDGTRVLGLSVIASEKERGYEWLVREAEATFTAVSSELFAALDGHRESTSLGEYAAVRLSEIFGLPSPSLKRPNLIKTDNGAGSTTPDDSTGGGAISSGTAYGSDDLVLDPYTGEYVEYGKLIERYYALLFDKIESGVYRDEEREALLKYFDILYGGFDDEVRK